MTSPDRFNVILRYEQDAHALEFWDHFCRKIILKDGTKYFYLSCSEVNTSDPIYLDVVAHPPRADAPHHFKIPHYLVFVISGATEGSNPIGFLQQDA